GGVTGSLGYPTGAPVCSSAADCVQQFERGEVRWNSVTGAHAFTNALIESAYDALGAASGYLGRPTSSAACAASGCSQLFQGGALHARAGATAAYAVDGAIQARLDAQGGVTGALGYPTSAPVCSSRTDCIQQFEKGEIRWNAAAGAHAFTSAAIESAYDALRGSAGYLGRPTGSTTCVASGCSQTFAGGALHVRAGDATAYAVDGAVRARYEATGSVTGPLGYPTANPVCAAGGCTQRFQAGQILWSAGTGAAAMLDGAVATEYARLGGTASYLGWPTGDTVCGLTGGGCKQQFARGAIYWPGTGGAYALDGAILAKWLANGAEAGALGYPSSSATKAGTNPDLYKQLFQRGSITWTAASGAVVGG
ncbi:MAG TPA: hypothetical protein VIL55_06715, partial [Naasia sp.]